MRRQERGALAVQHGVMVPAPVKGRATFTQTEDQGCSAARGSPFAIAERMVVTSFMDAGKCLELHRGVALQDS